MVYYNEASVYFRISYREQATVVLSLEGSTFLIGHLKTLTEFIKSWLFGPKPCSPIQYLRLLIFGPAVIWFILLHLSHIFQCLFLSS